MKWLVTVRERSKRCTPCRQADASPKRNRDLELRVKNALLLGQRVRWIKAHLTQADVERGRITAEDLHGNGQADVLANA
eukprot:4311441-Amphidinium_carterae.1